MDFTPFPYKYFYPIVLLLDRHSGIPSEVNKVIFALLVLLLSCIGFYRYFHRIPERPTPEGTHLLIAPADGVIWKIVALNGEPDLTIEKKIFGKIKTLAGDVENAAWMVSIFMNPLDCHANWSPLDGKIVSIKHTPGHFSFANTWSSLSNEKNEIVMETDRFRIKLIQIAGFVARRIVCWANAGERLSKGQVFGMIRLGSQVSLILPKQVSLSVKTGDRVRGGQTILGSWSS